MPSVARSVIEARRAAAHAAEQAKAAEMAKAAEQARLSSHIPNPRPRIRVVIPASDPSSKAKVPDAAASSEPAEATQPESEARADYDVGYRKPPTHTRFTKGCEGGPGRPKNSVSHDTLVKRQLDKKQRVRMNGRAKNVSMRELIVTKAILAAVEGKDRDARKFVLAESARLYGDADGGGGAPPSSAELNASDALSIEEYLADVRRDVRLELERELGIQPAGDTQ